MIYPATALWKIMPVHVYWTFQHILAVEIHSHTFMLFSLFKATKRPYFTCSRVGGSRGPIKSATSYDGQTDFTLEFESRFESGNLQKAAQV